MPFLFHSSSHPFLSQQSLATLANLFDELAYHYRFEPPEFDRIPFFGTPEPQNTEESATIHPTSPASGSPLPASSHSATPLSYYSPLSSTTQSSDLPHTMAFRADFKFCGTFSGKEAAASKWLKRLNWELKGYAVNGAVPPHRFIQALDLLLTEEAAVWAESHPQAAAIIAAQAPAAKKWKNPDTIVSALLGIEPDGSNITYPRTAGPSL